jgi:hypothetical protein
MRPQNCQVGFSQRIRLEWLEYTADLVLAGNSRSAVADALQQLLMDKVSVGGEAERSNRSKTITILTRIWSTAPSELEAFRTRGLELMCQIPPQDRIVLHWGMTAAAYPFWADVAIQVGRLMRLQGAASAAQVQRRMAEHYGQRETVSRATRRVMSSFVDWGMLSRAEEKGIYVLGLSVPVRDPRLVSWLVEATLRAGPNSVAPLRHILANPALFPFRLKAIHPEDLIQSSVGLEVLRQGIDVDLVELRS